MKFKGFKRFKKDLDGKEYGEESRFPLLEVC